MKTNSWLWVGGGAVLLGLAYTVVPNPLWPRGLRNNNPGNMIWGGRLDWWNASPSTIWRGMVGLDPDSYGRQFIKFDSPLNGLRALAENLLKHYQGLTLYQIGLKWAPPEDNGGDDSYGIELANQLGVDPNTVPDLSSWLPALLPAITKNENTLQPYGSDVIAQASGEARSATGTAGFLRYAFN